MDLLNSFVYDVVFFAVLAPLSILCLRRLKEVRRTIRKGYLKHCSIEAHEGEVMVSLAKRIVKDTCPYCAAPIFGAVYRDYKCQFCDNVIMGVVVKKN